MMKFKFLPALLVLVLAVGCDGNVQLKGKVVFSDDKSPVPVGTVCFQTDTFLARGNLKPDGTFVVGSLKQGDGLPPGTYHVFITDANKTLGYDVYGQAIMEPLIDTKYDHASSSGLTLEVDRSTRYIEFEVDRAPPSRR